MGNNQYIEILKQKYYNLVEKHKQSMWLTNMRKIDLENGFISFETMRQAEQDEIEIWQQKEKIIQEMKKFPELAGIPNDEF